MKKIGFTLAEVLVALTIIGVLAAITAPMLDGIIPDKNKVKVLKAYKTIAHINEELLSDPSLYMPDNAASPCEGLACTDSPSDHRYLADDRAKDATKYGFLVSEKMNLSSQIPDNLEGDLTFTTSDGIEWTIRYEGANDHHITIDLDTDSNNNCTYDTCANGTKPDRFEFTVLDNGTVRGRDRLTRAYLMNPNKLNDKKTDLAKAKTLK